MSSNILAASAHFDDAELGCGDTLAKHVKNGDKVTLYVATLSGYGNISFMVNKKSNAPAHGAEGH